MKLLLVKKMGEKTMTFKSALLIMLMTSVFVIASAYVQPVMANPAGEAVNEDDVTMTKSNATIRATNAAGGKEFTGAGTQAAGIECPDGACYKTGIAAPGYQGDGTPPVIDVPADSKANDPTKDAKDTKSKK
jgi:hypothetical protein